jgi:hypothetical protein
MKLAEKKFIALGEQIEELRQHLALLIERQLSHADLERFSEGLTATGEGWDMLTHEQKRKAVELCIYCVYLIPTNGDFEVEIHWRDMVEEYVPVPVYIRTKDGETTYTIDRDPLDTTAQWEEVNLSREVPDCTTIVLPKLSTRGWTETERAYLFSLPVGVVNPVEVMRNLPRHKWRDIVHYRWFHTGETLSPCLRGVVNKKWRYADIPQSVIDQHAGVHMSSVETSNEQTHAVECPAHDGQPVNSGEGVTELTCHDTYQLVKHLPTNTLATPFNLTRLTKHPNWRSLLTAMVG